MVVVEGESFLAGLEEEAFAEFQEELLELADDGGFEIGLGIGRFIFQAEEFEDGGIFEHVRGFRGDMAFLGEPSDACLVAAEGEALVEAGVDLPLEFLNGPPGLRGFNFVKNSPLFVSDAQENDIMRPTEGEGYGKRPRRWPAPHGWRQFRRRLLRNLRRTFLPDEEELPHVFEIDAREATSELSSETGGQVDQCFFAVGCAVLSLLLVVDNEAPNLEVGEDLQTVNIGGSSPACRLHEGAGLLGEWTETATHGEAFRRTFCKVFSNDFQHSLRSVSTSLLSFSRAYHSVSVLFGTYGTPSSIGASSARDYLFEGDVAGR